jgi:hypothetical protein
MRAWMMAGLLCLATGTAQAQDSKSFLDSQGRPPPKGSGFKPENPAVYRSFRVTPRFRAFLPPAYDLSQYFPPPGDQGRQGSCVAWSVGYAARSYYNNRYAQVDISNPANVLSPAFIYNSLNTGDCSNGLAISDALNLIRTQGGVSLRDLPYDADNCSRLPPRDLVARIAQQFQISDLETVDYTKIDDVKGQVYRGNPVVFGMWLPKGFFNLRDEVLDDTQRTPEDYGHAMVVVGYDDNKQALKVINSWGTRWGDGGFGWLSYRMFKVMTQNAFVMRVDRTNLPPAPPAPPAPVPPPSPAPTPQPLPRPTPSPVLTGDELLRQAGRIASSAECAQLQVQPVRSSELAIRGFVGSQTELDRVTQTMAQLSGGIRVDAQSVALRPWPQCEALITLAPFTAANRGLTLRETATRSALLTRGDRMVFEVTTPDFPSYVYVAYLQASGDGVHLLSPVNGQRTPPGTRIVLGDGAGKPTYRVTAPFGKEIVIVLASPTPLFPTGPLATGIEREFLSAYRDALLPRNGAANRPVASVLTLETKDK